jgi:O-antigen/teichoic acid export membrane protein
MPLFLLGLPLSVNYFIPQKSKSEQKAFNFQTYFLLVSSGFTFSLLLFISAPLISNLFNNPLLAEILRIFSCIPLLAVPAMYYQELLICLNRPRLIAILSSFLSLFQFSVIVIPVLLGLGLTTIFSVLIFFFICRLIIISYSIFKPFSGITINWQGSSIGNQLKYSIPIALSTIIGSLTLQIDKINIASFFSTTNFAIYANGAFQIPLIGIITGSVTAVLMPEFVRLYQKKDKKRLIAAWRSSIRKIALIIFPIMFFFLIFATEFITLLFSEEYEDSVVIFRIYLLALPVRITNFGMILLAIGLSSLIFRYAVCTLLLNLVLNYVFIQTIGFLGPAIATLFSIYLIAYLQLRKISVTFGLTIKDIFPWKILVHIAVLSGGIASLLFVIKFYISGDAGITSLLIGAILFSLLFFAGGLKTKLITNDDLKIPLRFFREICHF